MIILHQAGLGLFLGAWGKIHNPYRSGGQTTSRSSSSSSSQARAGQRCVAVAVLGEYIHPSIDQYLYMRTRT